MSHLSIFGAIDEVRRRTTEAVISLSGLSHIGLATELRRRLGSTDRALGALEPEPVLEAALPYLEAEVTLGELAPSLLTEAMVASLDGADDPVERNYRFRREWRPYAHQLQAWNALKAEPPRSVLVTSGTGSGKTECFLVPIIDDLARQAQTERLEGVQAIILYPLNALIASQEQRLKEWTRAFAPNLRFALYNGLLEERDNKGLARVRPEMAVDRMTLRASPPPILVTNVTMLEYTLLRHADAPIVQKSQGKLRYIVLDEAHSYVGAKAAEIALLLRRVCLAFGVDPKDVRFIATSATIGGSDAKESLGAFLSQVSGAPRSQVDVIEGTVRRADLPGVGSDEPINEAALGGADDAALYDLLAPHPRVRPLLEALAKGPVTLSAIDAVGQRLGVSGAALAAGIGAARRGDNALGPLRVHGFHRTVPGLWTCLDPACSQPRPAEWAFGAIATDSAEACRCGAPTYELLICNECGEPFVDVHETPGARLTRATSLGGLDEFADDADSDDDEEADPDADDAAPGVAPGPVIRRWLSRERVAHSTVIHIDPRRGVVWDRPGETAPLTAFSCQPGSECPACLVGAPPGGRGPVRPFRFGAPFLLANATPVFLTSADAAPASSEPDDAPAPSAGRQLLTFTDSRQGTARFAAKLQIGAERDFVRSFVYHAVQDALSKTPGVDPSISAAIAALEAGGNVAAADALRASHPAPRADRGLEWPVIVTRLAQRMEVDPWIKTVWRREERYEDSEKLAHFLLLREFMRRPRRANTLETLGLARLRVSKIDDLPDTRISGAFRALGGTAGEWRDYLHILLTWLLRANGAVDVDQQDRHWVLPNSKPRGFVRSADAADRRAGLQRWPKSAPGLASPRMVKLLAQSLGLPLDDAATRDALDECLDDAWKVLEPWMIAPGANKAQLDFKICAIAPVTQAWLCPVTRRLVDVTLRGYSPYGGLAEPIDLPPVPRSMLGAGLSKAVEGRAEIAAWLGSNVVIGDLRARGYWSNVTDRTVLFNDYFRSAEHSAQQPPARLRRYEEDFRKGRINILNCSTTMEMGVDIGSVSQVLMTNVPPSIASYRQRVGRAGRRRQALALGFTLCKDRPLDRDAFADPLRFLARQVRSPSVALDSRVIVQRHVNALLFASYFATQADDAMKLQAGAFFGCPSGAGAVESVDPPSALFASWLEQPSTRDSLSAQLASLVHGTVLQDDPTIVDAAVSAIREARSAFAEEWRALQLVLGDKGALDKAASAGLSIQIRRLCEDYLLSALAARGFLPGHGFPTGVVSFITPGDAAKDLGADEGARFRSYPQRSLDMAIREYAPGAEVVLDGLVYVSAGVTLNWKRPAKADDVDRDIQNLLFRWTCKNCGEAESTRRGAPDGGACPACGAAGVSWIKTLEPAGFRADRKPHADTDHVTFVPSDPPHVTARGTSWKPFMDPQLGRRRTSREGAVFFCASGPGGGGYDVCLQCGRAEPTPSTPRPTGRWDHRPLVGKPDTDGYCPGSNLPFATQQGLRLAHEITTDVFEAQCAGLTTRGGALALASALREALARLLGVEPEEMGISTSLRAGPGSGRAVSVFLFDKASGGAGFSGQGEDRFQEMLEGARDVLDCRAPGCVSGCPACVLTGDMSEDEARSLNRQEALACVDLLATEARPHPDDRAAPECYLVGSIFDDLLQAVKDGARRVGVFVANPVDPAALKEMVTGLDRLRTHGATLEVIFEPGATQALDGAARLRLRDVLSRLEARALQGRAGAYSNGARTVAEAGWDDGRRVVFASRDDQVAVGGADWGRPKTRALVRLRSDAPYADYTPVSQESLAPAPGARLQLIGAELNLDLGRFGSAFARSIRSLAESAGLEKAAALASADYGDAYLHSPLVMRLCLEALAGLSPRGRLTPVTLTTRMLPSDQRFAGRLYDNWRRDDHRIHVAQVLGKALNLDVTLEETYAEHARRLLLRFNNGQTVQVLLDQGFGAWRVAGRAEFDFRLDGQSQAQRLATAHARIQVATGGTWVVVSLD